MHIFHILWGPYKRAYKGLIKTLTYLLRYVNVLKKTMRKTPITHLNPTYIQCFSPPPKIMIMHCNRQNFLVSRNSTLTGKQKQIDRVAIRQFSLFTILILENSSPCKQKIRARSIFFRIHKKANNHFLMH